MKRNASAVWKGGLKDGHGTISTDSGVLSETPYSFGTRFEEGKGTNPEELIASAHAGCFSMALSGQLGKAGLTAERIHTTAAVKLEKTEAGFTITTVHLDVSAKVPGADPQAFEAAANNAKAGCPASKSTFPLRPKTYPGFVLWTIRAFIMTAAFLALILRGFKIAFTNFAISIIIYLRRVRNSGSKLLEKLSFHRPKPCEINFTFRSFIRVGKKGA